MGEMLHRRTWIFFYYTHFGFQKVQRNMKICCKGDIWKIWVSVSTLPELINLNTNYCGRILPETNSWWGEWWKYQYNIAGFHPNGSSQGLSDSCLLILGLYHTAPITPLWLHSHTNTFVLLPNSLFAPKPSTGSHYSALLSNDQKNYHYLKNWQLFPFPKLYLRLSPFCKEAWQWDPKATWQLDVPTALGMDIFGGIGLIN